MNEDFQKVLKEAHRLKESLASVQTELKDKISLHENQVKNLEEQLSESVKINEKLKLEKVQIVNQWEGSQEKRLKSEAELKN